MSMHATEEGAELHDLESVAGDERALAGLSRHGRTRRVKAIEMLGELWRDKAGFLGALFLVVVIVAAVFAPLVAPHDPSKQDLVARLTPPAWSDGGSWTNVLGTDGLGRDLLSRLIYGSRISIFVAVAVLAIAGTIGVFLGLIAGYRGGRTDRVIMRVVDTQIAFPGLLIAILLASLIGPSVKTVIFVLSVNGWMIFARMTRGVVLSVKEAPYVEAAEIVGCRPRRVMAKHILPNLGAPLSTLAVLEFARIVLAEAALSYLGVGVKRTDISWGLDVAAGQDFVFNSWWLVVMPGIAISLTVLSVNLVASWLRVVADPQEREKRFAFVQSREGRRRQRSMAEPLLEVDDLQVRFFTRRGVVQAVRDVSFHIDRAETVGLVGESGSGKSVTSQAIMGLIDLPGKITGGDIRWKGQSLHRGTGASDRMKKVRGKRDLDGLPGSDDLAQPRLHDRQSADRGHASTSRLFEKAGERTGRRTAGSGWHLQPQAAHDPAPGRVLGWNASACADRHGAVVRTGTDDRR